MRQLKKAAWQARQEIIQARLSRRDMLKLGLLTSAGYLVAKRGLSARASSDETDCELGSSPRTSAFVERLPIMPVLPEVPLADLTPAPSECPNNAINPDTGL